MAALPAWDLASAHPDAAVAYARALGERVAALAARAEASLRAGDAPGCASLLDELVGLEPDLDDIWDHARMRQYADATGEGVQELVGAVRSAFDAAREEIDRALAAFATLDDDAVDAILAAAPAAAYRLRRARALARHRLAPEAERAWAARAESARNRWASLQEQVESVARVRFDDGTGEREWGLGDLGALLRLPDAGVRRGAYRALVEGYGAIADVLAIAWDASVADRLAEDRLRGRSHPAQETLDDEGLSLAGLEELVDAVTARQHLRRRLHAVLAEALTLDDFSVADADAEPPGLPELSFDEVLDTATAGLASLAPALRGDVERLVAAGRLDVEPRAEKQGYAVTFTSVAPPHAFVAIRYTGRAANVLLLGHELGHAVALGRAYGAQPPAGRGWPGVIFEVPSLAGEIAAGEALAAAFPDRAEAVRLVAAQDLAWSVFESVAFCRVELDLYAARAAGRLLTTDRLLDAFAARFGELYGDTVTFGRDDAIVALGSWANYAIPSRFYDYQYAVGALAALALLASRRDDPERFAAEYVALLERGRSVSPAEQLAPFGLELGSRTLWEAGLDELERRFAELTGRAGRPPGPRPAARPR